MGIAQRDTYNPFQANEKAPVYSCDNLIRNFTAPYLKALFTLLHVMLYAPGVQPYRV